MNSTITPSHSTTTSLKQLINRLFKRNSSSPATHNAIRVIEPYYTGSTWAFDDEAVGLHREPFVSGVPEVLTQLVQNIPNAKSKGFQLFFSSTPFPDYQLHAERTNDEFSGVWYTVKSSDSVTTGAKGWLCPALFKYFDTAPKDLYIRAEAKK
jgi:hypothetical protein